MKDDPHYIDKIFSDQLSDFKALPDDEAWEGIATGLATGATGVGKLALLQKLAGGLFIAGYLLVGPLFWSDILFEPARAVQPDPMAQSAKYGKHLEAPANEDITQIMAMEIDHSAVDAAPETNKSVKVDQPEPSKTQEQVPTKPEQNYNRIVLKNDLSEGELKQESVAERAIGSQQLFEVENVVTQLHTLGYAYRTFLFPLLRESAPVDSVSTYYERPWKWYGSAYLMPVYWSQGGIARMQVGADLGRFVSNRSSIQVGFRYQLAASDPRFGDVGVLSIPLQYRYHLGRTPLKWFVGAGMVYNPGASPSSPFDQSPFYQSTLDLELIGGAVYQPGKSWRIFAAPSWQQPFGGGSGLSLQIGIQKKF